VLSCAGAAKSESPLTVVDTVNLDRYLGKWYEIASNPSWFQKGCTGSTAEYSLLSDGKIQVVNRCYKDSLEGPLKESKGKAEVADTTTNAKLKVWFFWPFKGDYWIIDLNRQQRGSGHSNSLIIWEKS
jgi:apolipoprotein D and lipocalin family protein